MFGRMHPQYFSGAVWIAHPSTLPQLLRLADGASHYIWEPSMGVTQGVANMPLFGLPVILSDKASPLGTRGDLMLANFSAYAFGMRQGAQLESTVSARWTSDAISFRVILRCDGKPLLDAPIVPRTDGSPLSAFVVLE
jgi:HK97 family phage major capsid protein